MQPLYLEEANRRLAGYVAFEERIIAESKQAVDCLNCESFLRAGIDAFNYLVWIDQEMRLAALSGKMGIAIDSEEFGELEDFISSTLIQWLGQSDRAMQWIKQCEDRHYVVDGKEDLLSCIDQARLIANPSYEMTDALEELELDALREHESGETAEWFSSEK
ncbi:hypothetical protein [Rubripirellula lacrimiformis]|nr:hypothetical protein [Rubripirellula lacrimiformis]